MSERKLAFLCQKYDLPSIASSLLNQPVQYANWPVLVVKWSISSQKFKGSHPWYFSKLSYLDKVAGEGGQIHCQSFSSIGHCQCSSVPRSLYKFQAANIVPKLSKPIGVSITLSSCTMQKSLQSQDSLHHLTLLLCSKEKMKKQNSIEVWNQNGETCLSNFPFFTVFTKHLHQLFFTYETCSYTSKQPNPPAIVDGWCLWHELSMYCKTGSRIKHIVETIAFQNNTLMEYERQYWH